jgi:hypothetical protein
LEQGSSQTNSLSGTDRVTLSLTETADLISDTIGISESFPAVDRFLGELHTSHERWKGHIIKTVEPQDLNFFDFVILAHAAHELHPVYQYFKEQCYFYAGLVFGAVASEWGQPEVCHTDQSGHGRYKGYKVKLIDKDDISKLINKYHSAHPFVISNVFLFKPIKNYC